MNSAVQKFNGLIGSNVSRKDLEQMAMQAQKQEQYDLAERLQTVLSKYPAVEDFELNKKSNPAIEVVPASFLSCLDCQLDKDDKIIGLGKAVSPNEIYQMITDRMIEKIKEANARDYKKKWKGNNYGTGYLIPFNFVSKKMYRGVNRFLLTDFEPLENPFYLTFIQVEELKGKVRKGAKGREVVYFTVLYRYFNATEKVDIASYDKKKFIAQLKANRSKIGSAIGYAYP